MRIDLLKKWLKQYPYGYCDGMNFQTCRANHSDCPYAMFNVHCSDGDAAKSYYWEMLRYMKLKPRGARKRTVMFAETFPSIMRSLDRELDAMARKVDAESKPLTLDELREAHKSKPTNADRIRSMSDEELAEWILQLVDCDKENVLCNPTEYKLSGKCNGRCLQGRLDWLKAETEGTE